LIGLADWVGLAATTFAAALLYAVSGFGFAVLAAPLYLLFVNPPRAIQLVIIISTALSLTVISGLRHAIAWRVLLRLTIGAVAGCRLGSSRFVTPIGWRCGSGRGDDPPLALLMALRWRRRGEDLAHALERALDFALFSLKDRRLTGGHKLHSGLACTSGTIGGAFGVPALAVELPISTTIMLRAIAAIAQQEGETLPTRLPGWLASKSLLWVPAGR
jgi:hypothetical protein